MRNKSYVFILASIIALAMLAGCAGQMGADTPKQAYLKSVMTFNGLLADYIADKRLAPPATRDKWTRTIDPLFEKGAVALKAWGVAVKAGVSDYDQQRAYLELKSQLLDILLVELTEYD